MPGTASNGDDRPDERNRPAFVIVNSKGRFNRTSLSGIFHGLHTAKGPTNYTLDRSNLKLILQHVQLKSDRILNRNIRKVDAVYLLRHRIITIHTGTPIIFCRIHHWTSRTSRSVAASQNVGTNDKIARRIECLSRTEQIAPPGMQASVTSQSMADDQNVVPGLVEGAVRHVLQLSTGQHLTRFQLKRFGVGEGVSLGCHLAVFIVHTGCRRRRELTPTWSAADQR